jgi:hypothetical protein
MIKKVIRYFENNPMGIIPCIIFITGIITGLIVQNEIVVIFSLIFFLSMMVGPLSFIQDRIALYQESYTVACYFFVICLVV